MKSTEFEEGPIPELSLAWMDLESGRAATARLRAEELLENVRGSDRRAEAYALSFLAHCARVGTPDLHRAYDFSRRAAQLFERLGDTRGETGALITLSHVTLILGRNDESVETALLAVRHSDHFEGALPVLAYNVLGLAYSWTGDDERADESLELAALRAERCVPALSPYQPRLNQIWVEASRLQIERFTTGQMGSLDRLRFLDAECHRLQSAGMAHGLLPGLGPMKTAIAYASSALLAVWSGEIGRATILIERARRALPPMESWLTCFVHCCEAELHWAHGQLDLAEHALRSMKRVAREVEHKQLESRAQLLLIQVLEKEGRLQAALHEYRDLRSRERRLVSDALKSRESLVTWQLESRNRERLLRSAFAETSAATKENNAKTRFLATASHDLRQPIHSMNVLIAALALRTLDERATEIVRLLNSVNQSLSRQLEGLLDISRLDAGMQTPDWSQHRVDEILTAVHAMFEPLASERGIHLQLDARAAFWVRTDVALLTRVLANLVDNAIKFTPRGGTVRLAARQLGHTGNLVVEDTGVGIPAEEQERIFEEFYQVGGDRDRSIGLGLGLSIVKRLSRLLELTLELRSSPGVGTAVTLVMPSIEGPSPTEQRNGSSATLHGMVALVVDDEEIVRTGMRLLLEELGCTVHTASSTASAERVAAHNPVDVLITDWHLGKSDTGDATIGAVLVHRPHALVIILTGDVGPDAARYASRSTFSLLRKPVSASNIMAAIERCIVLR